MNIPFPTWRRAAMAAVAAAATLCVGLVDDSALAAEKQPAPAAAAPSAPPDSAEAREILAEMGAFLAAQDRFSFEIVAAHDAVQASGAKIEFIDRRKLSIDRPNRLRMEVVQSDGDESIVTINESTITVQDFSKGVYAQVDSPGTLDDSIRYFMRDLGLRLPLAALLVSTVEGDLGRRVRYADLVEQSDILGKPAYHITGATDTVDFELWVEDSKRPLPLRIVLTYREAEGQPQFRANFSDWKLSPFSWGKPFEPKIGKNERLIVFRNQIPGAQATPVADAGTGAK